MSKISMTVFEQYKDCFKSVLFGFSSMGAYIVLVEFRDGIQYLRYFDNHTDALSDYNTFIPE